VRPWLLHWAEHARCCSLYSFCSKHFTEGHEVASWLRHYATSRKVAGSIPHEIIESFNCPNTSSRTVALGSTQPLT
jgi:hypothetical protein